MDNLAHDYPAINHRKRKADTEDYDCPESVASSDALRPDPSSSAATATSGLLNAPRQPYLTSETDKALWPSSSSSHTSSRSLPTSPDCHTTKRPRLDKLHISGRKSRRSTVSSCSPLKSPYSRQGNDIEDIGIVSTVDPGPSSGTLLRKFSRSPWPLAVSFDSAALPVPPPKPLINRETLKELDLDSILRNPQLRHDLLFDPGLQFRPTGSKRKREMADRYWTAIIQEVERGCTCMTFDPRRKPHRTVCLCGEPSSSSETVLHQVGPDLFTARTPSRLPALLSEFLEVLLLVIQPLCSISGLYVNPNTFKTQMDEHAAQAVYIRSIFDPVLIEQELRHNSFDPAGLFRIIGDTLKGHCAPMRDRSVEAMIRVAGHCGTSCPGTAARDSIKAFRMCMEILELMKLDIANHQLQTLRPFLLRTSGQLELRTLKSRYGETHSLSSTREWIQAAHEAMLLTSSQSRLNLPGNTTDYRALSSNQQLYTSVLRGIVDLVFDPSPANSSPSSSTSRVPETLYLDSSRLLALSSDAVDATSLCMLLLLYRQLVFSDKSSSRPKVADADLVKIKLEVRDIAGSYRLGRCLARDLHQNGKEAERWRAVKEDVVLQVARRADATRCGEVPASASLRSTPSTIDVSEGVDQRSLNVALTWADTHMRSDSPLSSMLHKRLKETVLNAVLHSAYPGRDLVTGCRPVVLDFSPPNRAATAAGTTLASGMEPLADEIRALAEKISLLALIHLNAYLPMYESEGFAPSR